MDVGQAYRNVKKGSILPVYVLAGDSAFLRREMLSFLCSELVDQGSESGDCDRVDADNAEQVLGALDLAMMPTFSGGRRVIVITGGDVFGGKKVDPDVTDAVCRYFESPITDVTVVFEVPVIDGRRKTTAAARKRGFVVDCAVPEGRDLIKWVQKRATLAGKKIGPDTVMTLIDRTGKEMALIAGEIDKLSAYVGDRQQIGRRDVEAVVSASAQATAFALVDAVLDGNAKLALETLNSLWRANEAPVRLLALLHSQIRVLAVVRSMLDQGTASREIERSGIAHPYVIRKCLGKASNTGAAVLAQAIVRLHETDVMIKTGRLDARLAVELLVYELSSLPADH